MLSAKKFIILSFPQGVYVGNLNLIASSPNPTILTLVYQTIKPTTFMPVF